MHVARAEQPDELVVEMVAIEQDEDDQDHDDADGQERIQQGRHEAGHVLEIRTASLHAHRRHGRGTGGHGEVVAERGDHGQEAAQRAAALRQSADILDLLLQVGLVTRQAAGDLGELRRDEHGQQAGDDKGGQHDHRHGERQWQETAHPGHGGTQDEGEEHGDRCWDQHLAAEIERHDRGRANESDGGGAHEARLVPGRSRKIKELHGGPQRAGALAKGTRLSLLRSCLTWSPAYRRGKWIGDSTDDRAESHRVLSAPSFRCAM
jgi:hypothetical protein